MITKYIIGDIVETELFRIAHGVNCQNVMGSGVAKALYTKFPEVKNEYHYFVNCMQDGSDHSQTSWILGNVNFAKDSDKIIANCFTQDNFGYDGKRYVNYKAVVKCFEYLAEQWKNETIAIPKIGCGLAGGNWTFMEQLINDTVGDKLEIWVYELEEKKYSKGNDLG